MIINIEQKIINLLEQIGCFWPPHYTALQLKTISKTWNKKLFYYDDDILIKALDDLAETFHRKPLLADFLEVCKKHQIRKTPVAMTIIKEDFIDQFEFRAKVARQYGEEAAKKVDNAYTEYREYKKIGKMDKYRKIILLRSQTLKNKILLKNYD